MKDVKCDCCGGVSGYKAFGKIDDKILCKVCFYVMKDVIEKMEPIEITFKKKGVLKNKEV